MDRKLNQAVGAGPQPFLRARDVAQALGIKKRWALYLIQRGCIPGRKVRGIWFVDLADFVDWWIRALGGEGLTEWLGSVSSADAKP